MRKKEAMEEARDLAYRCYKLAFRSLFRLRMHVERQ